MKSFSYTPFALSIVLACVLGSASHGQEFKQIFNGKDLSGWKGNPKLWSVEDGAITGITSDDDPIAFNTFLIWGDGEVANFELELDYRIGAEGNSGIQYRSKIVNEEDFVVAGYQADIDASMQYAGINYSEKTGRNILAQRGQRVTYGNGDEKQVDSFGDAKELGEKIKAEDWNHYRIVAKGNKLSHYINGTLMSEVIDNDSDKAEAKGVLALQIHRGPAMKIQFKNIKLRELD